MASDMGRLRDQTAPNIRERADGRKQDPDGSAGPLSRSRECPIFCMPAPTRSRGNVSDSAVGRSRESAGSSRLGSPIYPSSNP